MTQEITLDQKIIAYALKDKTIAMELSTSSITEEYFAPQYRWLYKTIMEHFENPKYKSIPTRDIIAEYASKLDTDLDDDVVGLYDQIAATEIDNREFTWILDKFRVRYNKILHKSLIKDSRDIIKSGQEDALDKVNRLVREAVVDIDSIYKRETYEEGSLSESAQTREDYYRELEANPDMARGILTGFTEFDRITNGLHPGELMIVAGATGTGKSVVMHNIGVNAYLNRNDPFQGVAAALNKGHNVLYFSLEMPKSSMERRIDSCMGGLIYNYIRDGKLSEEEKDKYFEVLKFQMEYPYNFHIVDMPKGATTREIELKFVELCETKFKPDLVIIDYIGIMAPNEPGDSDWLALGKIAADLHEFARVYNIPVITGSQVNRPKDPNKQHYSTDRLARSDMVTNNANIIIQIGCRDDEYARADMPIYIIKMRDGEKGSFVLSKDFPRMKLIDMVDETFAGDDDDDLGI